MATIYKVILCSIFLVSVCLKDTLCDTTKASQPLLQFGDKCSIPRQGGELSIVAECDASKGLICNGEACVCTFADYFSYDPASNECRKKIGKACRHVKYESELTNLPFNLKCHATAQCILVSRAVMVDDGNNYNGGFSMCVCKEGFVPTDNLSGCQVPPPKIDFPPLPTESSELDYE